jgi:hypothetical protein
VIEELLAKLRGVDKWPETQATVVSVDRVVAEGRYAARATVTFSYRPAGGEIQSGTFFVGDQSSLYNLDETDTFPVRYNPARPESFYSSEYTIPFWWKFYGILICVFVLTFLYILFVPRAPS